MILIKCLKFHMFMFGMQIAQLVFFLHLGMCYAYVNLDLPYIYPSKVWLRVNFWVGKFLFEILKIGHGKPAPTLVTSLCWVRPFSGHMKPNKCAKREMFTLCEYHIDIVVSLCHFSPLHLMFSNFSGSTIRVSWCTIFIFFWGWKTNYICTWN